jgi:hypothetical protein
MNDHQFPSRIHDPVNRELDPNDMVGEKHK